MAISKSKLSKKRLGDWVINPYVGCEHGCKHCYCPAMPGVKFFNNGRVQREWGTYLFPKPDWAAKLKKDLIRFRQKGSAAGRGFILCSFLTDCYTPAEAKYQLTRQSLELLLAAGLRVRVQTRSALIERDLSLYREHRDKVLVGTSLPYLDDHLARVLEPGASAPSRRVRMLERFASAGVPIYVAVAPFMPFHTIVDFERVLNAIRPLNPVEVFDEVLNPRSDNLDMMNDALAAAGEVRRIDSGYPAAWPRYTLNHLWEAQAVCAAAGLGDRFIAWPDPRAAKSKSLTNAEREWLQAWLPSAQDLVVK